MDEELKATGDEKLAKVKSGRKPNAEKDLDVKTKDLRCRVTDADYEIIETHFKGKKSEFLYKAVQAYIESIKTGIASTTFSEAQHKLYVLFNTQKIDDFNLGLIDDVLNTSDRQLLLARMNQKLRWDKATYRLRGM